MALDALEGRERAGVAGRPLHVRHARIARVHIVRRVNNTGHSAPAVIARADHLHHNRVREVRVVVTWCAVLVRQHKMAIAVNLGHTGVAKVHIGSLQQRRRRRVCQGEEGGRAGRRGRRGWWKRRLGRKEEGEEEEGKGKGKENRGSANGKTERHAPRSREHGMRPCLASTRGRGAQADGRR